VDTSKALDGVFDGLEARLGTHQHHFGLHASSGLCIREPLLFAKFIAQRCVLTHQQLPSCGQLAVLWLELGVFVELQALLAVLELGGTQCGFQLVDATCQPLVIAVELQQVLNLRGESVLCAAGFHVQALLLMFVAT
jgi:hypothetical protein